MEKKFKRISLKDIADKVGVSTALVSYVLNGQEKEKRVGAEVAKRIREVAQELNYTPDQIAQSLRKGSTKTIGLIVTDIANPFFGTMARIIEDEANQNKYTVILGSSDEDCEKSSILVNALLDRRVDGFIIVPADGRTDYIKSLVDKKVPLVMIDRFLPEITTSYVVLDNYQACYKATGRLIEKGYKSIGMVAYKNSLIHMKERIRGYTEAMQDHELQKNIIIKEIRHKHIDTDSQDVMKSLTGPGDHKKVEAVLFATNALSIKGMYYIIKNHIRVPDQLDVIGFDGNAAFDFFYPPLTHIQQPIEEMAKESVRILLEQINGTKKISQIILQPELVIR